jgi:hypothetical protein
MKNNPPSQSDLLKNITLLCETKPKSKSILNEYRRAIIFLLINNYSQKDITEYLNKNQIKTSVQNVGAYLRKYPVTKEEFKLEKDEYKKKKKEAIKERNEKLKNLTDK